MGSNIKITSPPSPAEPEYEELTNRDHPSVGWLWLGQATV